MDEGLHPALFPGGLRTKLGIRKQVCGIPRASERDSRQAPPYHNSTTPVSNSRYVATIGEGAPSERTGSDVVVLPATSTWKAAFLQSSTFATCISMNLPVSRQLWRNVRTSRKYGLTRAFNYRPSDTIKCEFSSRCATCALKLASRLFFGTKILRPH